LTIKLFDAVTAQVVEVARETLVIGV